MRRRNPVLFANPAKIPAKLILDPLAPIPPSLGKKDRILLQELREAYAFSMQERLQGEALSNPEVTAALFAPIIGHMQVEHLAVVGLNTKCKPMGPPVIITRGETDSVDVPIRAVLRTVLVQEAMQFIMAHNHPSGDPTPSAADRAITTQMVAAGKAVSCPLVDHVIVTNTGRFVSLRRDAPELWRQ